jgi:hypothetical protein
MIRTALIPTGLLTIQMALILIGLLIGLTDIMVTTTRTTARRWKLQWM